MAEILLHLDLVNCGDGGAIVEVRVGDADVRLNDVFTTLRGYDLRIDMATKQLVPDDPGPTQSIALRVEWIEVYGESCGVAHCGQTCRIRLAGDGLERLRPRTVISGQVDRPARQW